MRTESGRESMQFGIQNVGVEIALYCMIAMTGILLEFVIVMIATIIYYGG